jgi:hypothetical protein
MVSSMTNDSMREKLIAVANLLADLTSAVAEVAAEFGEVKRVEKPAAETQPTEKQPSENPLTETQPEEKQPTMEEVRAILAEISRNGKTEDMKALLHKFGATRLSEIKPEDYTALIEAARGVADA